MRISVKGMLFKTVLGDKLGTCKNTESIFFLYTFMKLIPLHTLGYS